MIMVQIHQNDIAFISVCITFGRTPMISCHLKGKHNDIDDIVTLRKYCFDAMKSLEIYMKC